MAEAESFILPSKLSIPGQDSPSHKAKQSHPKFLSGLPYKAVFVVVLVALLPLFPAQAPDFVSQSILTRSWELIHLLFVGIAVSYGLFSRRNADHEADKETSLKADTPKSYVSRILQVSSVFDDDEVVSPSGCPDDSKIQTWSSQYHPGEPVVVVEKGSSNGDSSSNKPLFLPVRSLKSRAQSPESIHSCDEIDGRSVSGNGSRLVSSTMDEIGRRGSFRGLDALGLKDDVRGSVVLPSPIPWRSRSERMEVKDEMVAGTGITSPPIDANSGPSKTPSFRSSDRRSASTTPSPKRLSPSSSFSPETRAKTSEDSVKKKSFYKFSPPPAPPPPPVPVGHMSGYILDRKDRRKNFNDELKDLSRRVNDSDMGSSGSSIARSVRTVRWKQLQGTMLDAATMSSPDEPLEDLGSATHRPFLPRLPTRSTEKKNELVEKVTIASDDSESESDCVSESSDVEDAPCSAMEAKTDENEVDKKADEFIAKFREQIRLQRIESIKRSSGHRSVKNPK